MLGGLHIKHKIYQSTFKPGPEPGKKSKSCPGKFRCSLEIKKTFIDTDFDGLYLARADFARSIALLQQAVALDPEFARAWETLAAAYVIMPSWGNTDQDYLDLAAGFYDITSLGKVGRPSTYPKFEKSCDIL